MRRANQIAGAVGVVFALSIIWSASKMTYTVEYSPGAGFFPLWLGIFFAILSLALLLSATFPPKEMEKRKESFLPDREGTKKGILFLASFTLCIALIGKLGFLIACFSFTLFFLVIVEKYSLIKGLLSSFCIAAGLYLLFNVALQVPLPKGLLGI